MGVDFVYILTVVRVLSNYLPTRILKERNAVENK